VIGCDKDVNLGSLDPGPNVLTTRPRISTAKSKYFDHILLCEKAGFTAVLLVYLDHHMTSFIRQLSMKVLMYYTICSNLIEKATIPANTAKTLNSFHDF
jgi:hypothetical protein